MRRTKDSMRMKTIVRLADIPLSHCLAAVPGVWFARFKNDKRPEVPEMAADLRQLIRASYNNALMVERNAHSAFERAVEVLIARRPLLSDEQARNEVATMLGVELPISVAAD
jgi:hypothetical protein